MSVDNNDQRIPSIVIQEKKLLNNYLSNSFKQPLCVDDNVPEMTQKRNYASFCLNIFDELGNFRKLNLKIQKKLLKEFRDMDIGSIQILF